MSATTSILLRMAITLAVLLSVAPLLVWVERRLLGRFQLRYGPNRVGPLGILQTVADLGKLLSKEIILPESPD